MKTIIEDTFGTGQAEILRFNFLRELMELNKRPMSISKTHIAFYEDSIKRYSLPKGYSYKEVEWSYYDLKKVYDDPDLIIFDTKGASTTLYNLMWDNVELLLIPIDLDEIIFEDFEEVEKDISDLFRRGFRAEVDLICFSKQDPVLANRYRDLFVRKLEKSELKVQVHPTIIRSDEAVVAAFKQNMTLREFDPQMNDVDRFLEITKDITAFDDGPTLKL